MHRSDSIMRRSMLSLYLLRWFIYFLPFLPDVYVSVLENCLSFFCVSPPLEFCCYKCPVNVWFTLTAIIFVTIARRVSAILQLLTPYNKSQEKRIINKKMDRAESTKKTKKKKRFRKKLKAQLLVTACDSLLEFLAFFLFKTTIFHN